MKYAVILRGEEVSRYSVASLAYEEADRLRRLPGNTPKSVWVKDVPDE